MKWRQTNMNLSWNGIVKAKWANAKMIWKKTAPMRTGIPLQYMKQINGKIKIHTRDMGTSTWPPPPPTHKRSS